jgi:TonB-dependent receptor
MKTIVSLMVMGLMVFTVTSWSQTAIITGQLTDEITGDVLPGATVLIDGTNEGSFSDLNGSFVLRTARTGPLALRITYIGYESLLHNLVITERSATHVELTLKPQTGVLSEVVITESLQGQARALNQQRSSDVIMNVVSADQIGRFPDPNAAEALQRVQGVNIERDQGEGRYILIRGLAPQFTNISINGEQVPSPEAGVRYVALDAIPSDQLASMEIFKSLRPDLDGDAIGGSVNLITRKAQTAKPEIQGSLVGGFNALMGRANGQGSLQYGQRFFGDKLGVMLNGSYYVNNLGSHNWERDTDSDVLNIEPHQMELRDYELARTRRGLSATIDYRFNERNELYFRAMNNTFTDREWRRRMVFNPADEEVEQLVKDRFESQTVNSFNLGGIHQFKGFSLDYEGAYAYAEQDTPYDNEVAFIAGDMGSTLDFSNNDFPGLTANPSYLDDSLFGFDEFETGNTLATDENITAKMNVSVSYTLGSTEGTLKFGVKGRFKTKDFVITQNIYEGIAGVPNADAFSGGYFSEDFLDGQYTLNAFPNMPDFINYFNANPEQFELQIEDKVVNEALEAYTATEDVLAGYAMTTHRFKKLVVVAGARYELTRVTYNSEEVVFNANDEFEAVLPVSGSSNYGFFLPQVNLKYSLSDETFLRGAATYSYSRPNFEDIIPSQEVNVRDREASIGNPDLLPVEAINLDAFIEHYMPNLGLISGGVYFKQLDNFIYSRRFEGAYPLNSPTPIADGLLYTRSENGGTANLFGLEFGIQRQLDFLPGKLKNLALYMNYTFTDSRAAFQRTDDERLEEINLPGQAAHVGNFSLAYNGDKLMLRAAANLNGSYLAEIGPDAANDIFVNQRIQIDLTAGYRLTDNWRLFAEFVNLTNQPFELYSGDSEQVMIQREFYSWWSRAGIKFNFN